jgi:hypothetical protein
MLRPYPRSKNRKEFGIATKIKIRLGSVTYRAYNVFMLFGTYPLKNMLPGVRSVLMGHPDDYDALEHHERRLRNPHAI